MPKKELNITPDAELDPTQSGAIGIEFSAITTTVGELRAKQTSINPDFAALFLRWFYELELRKGQCVVIHASASFPALTFAAISACEVYGVVPHILSSVGASSFGANQPEFTFWDMENLVFEKGLVKHKTEYATYGGQNDNGSSFWDGGMEISQKAAARNGLDLHIPNDLQTAIKQKYDYLQSLPEIALFINIGGNQTALGDNVCAEEQAPGVINTFHFCASETPGLIHKLSERGIPVLHLLNIRDLAIANGVAIELQQNVEPGKARVYFVLKRPNGLIVFSLVVILFAFTFVLRAKL